MYITAFFSHFSHLSPCQRTRTTNLTFDLANVSVLKYDFLPFYSSLIVETNELAYARYSPTFDRSVIEASSGRAIGGVVYSLVNNSMKCIAWAHSCGYADAGLTVCRVAAQCAGSQIRLSITWRYHGYCDTPFLREYSHAFYVVSYIFAAKINFLSIAGETDKCPIDMCWAIVEAAIQYLNALGR